MLTTTTIGALSSCCGSSSSDELTSLKIKISLFNELLKILFSSKSVLSNFVLVVSE